MKKSVILIYGLPNSGKTTLAQAIHNHLHCIWFNADEVRQTLSRDLTFSQEHRVEQARRLGAMANLSLRHSKEFVAIVDFVNPTVPTFDAFMEFGSKLAQLVTERAVPRAILYETSDLSVFSIYMDTIAKEDCPYQDTAALFETRRAISPDLVFTKKEDPEEMAQIALKHFYAKTQIHEQREYS